MPLCDAIFDCNIFLQAAARPNGPSGRCWDLVESGFVHLYVCPEILTELSDVMRRPETREYFTELDDDTVDLFLEKVLAASHLVKNGPKVFSLTRDMDDEAYISLAVENLADFLVTRDRDLLDLMTDFTIEAKEFRQRFRPLKVVDPVEFLGIVEKLSAEN